MILSDFDLRNYIKTGRLKIEPFDESIIRENGLDLRLGNKIASIATTTNEVIYNGITSLIHKIIATMNIPSVTPYLGSIGKNFAVKNPTIAIKIIKNLAHGFVINYKLILSNQSQLLVRFLNLPLVNNLVHALHKLYLQVCAEVYQGVQVFV